MKSELKTKRSVGSLWLLASLIALGLLSGCFYHDHDHDHYHDHDDWHHDDYHH